MVYRAIFLAMALLAMTGPSLAGNCIKSQTLGTWTNPFAGNRSDLTKLEIRAICTKDTVPHIQVKAYTACAPRDCTWGRSIAEKKGDFGLKVAFRTFFAMRTVTVSINGRRMEAKILDDYHDPRKANEHRSFVLWKK